MMGRRLAIGGIGIAQQPQRQGQDGIGAKYHILPAHYHHHLLLLHLLVGGCRRVSVFEKKSKEEKEKKTHPQIGNFSQLGPQLLKYSLLRAEFRCFIDI